MPTIYKPKKREQKSNNMYDDAVVRYIIQSDGASFEHGRW